jgi:sugar lactone lactonase YvrE
VLPQNGNAQSVPTALTRGPDGALYVGEFVGENVQPKPAARVFRIVPGRRGVRRTRIEIFRTGFINISGLAFDSRRNLYVTELGTDPTGQSPAGDVVRVTPGNRRTRLAGSALFFPTGGAVRGRFLYVSNWSVLTGDPGPQGSPFAGQSGTVVRIRIR